MISAQPGMQVRKGQLPELGAVTNADDIGVQSKVVEPELLVIGGGAGGLTAASIAAEAGVDVVLIDERTVRGGQYFKQPAGDGLLPASLADDRQIAGGRKLVERANCSGAKIVTEAKVWGAFAPAEFGVLDNNGSTIYRPKRTIVATGAYERGLPVPGWTLPGVMTTGATQGMLRNYGTFPTGRIVVAGNGPLNLQIALELKRAGADVRLVAELSDTSAATWIANGLRMAVNVPRSTLDGVALLRGLKRAGVPPRFGEGLAAVRKTAGGLEAHIGPLVGAGIVAKETIEADVVCVGYGFQPSNEILRCLACRHSFDEARGYLVAVCSAECETTVPGVYAVGDCTGLSGAPSAIQDGVIAAISVARSLDYEVSGHHESELRRALRARPRHRVFQAALWNLFAAPRFSTQLATADTVICRCENVTLGDIEAAMDDGAVSMAGIKQRTRLGMGPCQGRYCAPIVADFIAARTGQSVDEFSYFAPRSPITPARIADIVGRRKA